MSCVLDIKGLDKKELLIELRNAGHHLPCLPMSVLDNAHRHEALRALEGGYINYFGDVAIKTNLSGDTADFRQYERDAGEGAALLVVMQLKQKLHGL